MIFSGKTEYINRFIFINHDWFEKYISKNVVAFNEMNISVQAHFLLMLLVLRQRLSNTILASMNTINRKWPHLAL